MLFNSFEFLCFLILVFGLYYCPLFRRIQIQLLVAASLFFYAWSNPSLLALLAVSIAFNVWLSYRLAFSSNKGVRTGLVAGLTVNLGLIVFFKYAGLIVRSLGLEHRSWGGYIESIPLPIGISFYTFEAISLLLDVARARRSGADTFVDRAIPNHVAKTSLFVSFFPHLISGPILRAYDFYPQIGAKRLCDINWWYCVRLLILGFFLKCVIADNLKDVTSEILYPKFLFFHSLTLLALIFGYAMQIFADFAGYSSIAIGLGALFGYRLPINFNFPYVADSLADFWRRWHISLSSWLKDYLYIPLGGSRGGSVRTYWNLFLVMFLGGLWHGAAWSFAIWGLYHGIGLALERIVSAWHPNLGSRIPRFLRIFFVFMFVTLGWVLFKLNDFSQVPLYLAAILENWRVEISGQRILIFTVALFSLPVMAYHAMHISEKLRSFCDHWQVVIYGVMLAACILAPGLGGAFIYFQF